MLRRRLICALQNRQVLTISPSQTGAVTSDRTVVAKLVGAFAKLLIVFSFANSTLPHTGDFAAWRSPPVLSSKYLLVPNSPRNHPAVLVCLFRSEHLGAVTDAVSELFTKLHTCRHITSDT